VGDRPEPSVASHREIHLITATKTTTITLNLETLQTSEHAIGVRRERLLDHGLHVLGPWVDDGQRPGAYTRPLSAQPEPFLTQNAP